MKLYAFLADGFETVEAIGVIDILRRGKVDVCTVSISGSRTVTSSHKIPVEADALFDELDFEDGDALFLPGGVPGTPNLEAHEGLSKLIDKYDAEGKILAAICAAPSILGHHNVLKGRKATCFPGYEEELYGAEYTGEGVVRDGRILTGKGMGKTVDMGLALLEMMSDKENAELIKGKIQY